MTPDQVKRRVEQGLSTVEVTVEGDGSHFNIVVIGACFEGKSLVEKQKIVYAVINDAITSGEIHAVTIKAYTAQDWEKARKFLGSSL